MWVGRGNRPRWIRSLNVVYFTPMYSAASFGGRYFNGYPPCRIGSGGPCQTPASSCATNASASGTYAAGRDAALGALDPDTLTSPADLADAGLIFGTGFAPFRGGPLNYLAARSSE